MSERNWFELAKNIDIKNYLETHYACEFKKNFCLCPFHVDSKPTLSVKGSEGGFFQCFSCGAAGDIVKWVELHDKLSPLEAVKKVLSDNGIEVGGTAEEIDPQEQARRNAKIQKLQDDVAQKKATRKATEERARIISRSKMAKIAPVLSENLHTALREENEKVIDSVKAVIPGLFNVSMSDGIVDNALGWDYDNSSVVIINRYDGATFNIKYRTKKGFDGKWISWKDSTTKPFGQIFWDEDDRIIICEGEKDALNLLSLGINAVTLGGVTNHWENFRDILKDKIVYIWFDHDRAGYIESFKRYKEIFEITQMCQVVLFYKLGIFPSKYDISDFLAHRSFGSKEEVFQKIIYSSFNITNDLIDELIEELGLDNREKRDHSSINGLLSLKSNAKILKFRDIKKDILAACRDIKGEKDAEVAGIEQLSRMLEKNTLASDLESFINSLFKEKSADISATVDSLKKVVKFKKTLLNNYRQTHIYDMVMELKRATESCRFEFAKYRGFLYIWTGNYYYLLEDWEINDFILQSYMKAARVDFKKQITKNRNEIFDNLKGQAVSLEGWIDTEKRVINMLNGTLIIRANGKYLFKTYHDKKDCALNILPVEYNKSSKAPKWQTFLNRILPNQLDQDALMEFIGYCFLPSHEYEKFLLLYGSTGANGKSVVLNVIKDFFGRENVSSLQLHQFEGHELDALQNKIINIGSEIESGGDLKRQLASLKALISPEDSININPKNRDGYELYPEEKPKMAFATNKLPKSGVDDGGVLRRMLLLNFAQEIKDNEKIRDLTTRFRDERAGILNMALTALRRLIQNGTFSQSEESKKFMEEYKDDLNPVRAYANECLVTSKGIMTPKKFVYNHYRAWCELKGYNPYADRTFWAKLKEQKNFEETQKRGNQVSHELLASSINRFLLNVALSDDIVEKFNIGKEVLEVKNSRFSASVNARVSFE